MYKGIIINIKQFKWGNILIVNINGLNYQVIDTQKQNLSINDFIEITGVLKVPDNPIINPDIQKEEILAENINTLIKGNHFDENSEIFRLTNIKDVLIKKSEFVNTFNEYFKSYINIQTPKMLLSTSEGGADVFNVGDYILSQSPQLYKQMLCINFNNGVKELAVCFRNEKFNSSKHTNEFVSMDCEFPINEPIVENVYKQPLEFLMELLNINEYKVISLESDEIKEVLNRDSIIDLNRADEIKLYESLNADLIVTINYDNGNRAFYTYKNQSFDILYKGVEICSGSVRIFNHNEYIESFKQRNMNTEKFKDYLETFKTKSIYTGGFAIGLDRLTSLYFNINNIKDVKI